jgi:chloramphenicol-sensitive protein RarD
VTAAAAPAEGRSNIRFGVICGALAYAMWGAFPLYLKQLSAVEALEIVCHRIVWAVPVGAIVLSFRNQWKETLSAFRAPKVVARLLLSAALIAGNWLVYVWAVADNRVLEASLGYYINPLMLIALGVFVLRERLRPPQVVAIALAAAGVAWLAFANGVPPYVSIVLALSFSLYGYVRKTTQVGAMPGLFIETTLLAPMATAFLGWRSAQGGLAFGANGLGLDVLLALAGPVTVAPLLLFALAARRLTLTTLGFLQYIGPTGQLLLGLYYGEAFTPAHAVCFSLIWLALAIITIDAIVASRRSFAKPL